MKSETLFPLIISNTDMSLISQCELKWFRERCQWLRKPSFNNDLVAGASFAKGLEIARKDYYWKVHNNETLKLSNSEIARQSVGLGYENILESMHEQFEKFEQGTDVLKSPERMALALKTYFIRFPLEEEELIPFKLEDSNFSVEHKLTVELLIQHPELGIPLIFKGKLDMLAKDSNNRIYLVDEKTTKQISANTGDLLKASGQFIGYAWLGRQHGINITEAKVRKIAIQVRDIKVEEFPIAITDFMVDNWEKSMYAKLKNLVYQYFSWKSTDFEFFKAYFLPDYDSGCTSYFRPCPFIEGCISKYGENFIDTEFEQIIFDSEERKEISLNEYKKLLGLV